MAEGLNDLDLGGSCSLEHVRRAEPAREGDDKIGSALGDHELIARRPIERSRPVPFRQEVPFQHAAFPRPSPRNAIDAARPAVDQADERAASGVEAVQHLFHEFRVTPIAAAADQDSQFRCPQAAFAGGGGGNVTAPLVRVKKPQLLESD
jgi:hypothetical protein